MTNPDAAKITKMQHSVHAVCIACTGNPTSKRRCLRVKNCPLGKTLEDRKK